MAEHITKLALNYLTYSLSLESICINYVYISVSNVVLLTVSPTIINTDKIVSRHVSFDPLPPDVLQLEAVLGIISTHY